MAQIVLYENVCAITMQNRESATHKTDEILVMQSHTSVGNRIVFKGLVRVGGDSFVSSNTL